MLNYCILGKNIRALRLAHEMTQEDLAEQLNLGPDYVSKLETGTKHPSVNTIEKIAKFFNVDIYDIVTEGNETKDKYTSNDLYSLLSNLEPETKIVLKKTAEAFQEINKDLKESENE